MWISAAGTEEHLGLDWNKGSVPLISLGMLAKGCVPNAGVLSLSEGDGNYLA